MCNMCMDNNSYIKNIQTTTSKVHWYAGNVFCASQSRHESHSSFGVKDGKVENINNRYIIACQ